MAGTTARQDYPFLFKWKNTTFGHKLMNVAFWILIVYVVFTLILLVLALILVPVGVVLGVVNNS